MLPFETFEHTADIGLRAYGKTLKETFENAARGMFSIMVEPDTVEPREKMIVRAEAIDVEGLLVAWLNELLFLFDANHFLFRNFEIERWDEESKLKAVAYGEPIDQSRHQFEIEIKACTYHMLKVAKNQEWSCQVIFDV